MTTQHQIRQPIVTVCGHVDHGKTSLLDRFRGSSVQSGEAGGITQKISFTKYPFEQILKTCPLIQQKKISLNIPGFLFIDTPGHAAFINLRKRGGSLADLAIVVVGITEGIKPQTAEVLQILRANKTPFLIALNKIDNISGWRTSSKGIKDSIDAQPVHVRQQFEELLLFFQASLQEHGFKSDLFFNVTDFTKEIAIVPCSARTNEGISELLFVLCGLCQGFLKEKLNVVGSAKGVILEIKKERNLESVEAILYDGYLSIGDEIAISSFGEVIVSKVRALEEILPLSTKYKSVDKSIAASGIKIHFANKEGVLPGMLFQKIEGNLSEIKSQFKKELAGALPLDKQGIVVKAESLGSLEALVTLLHQNNISVVKAGIGPISKQDIISAQASGEQDSLNGVILGFNSELEEGLIFSKINIISNKVIYKLIEELQIWRKNTLEKIEREALMSLVGICKLEVLHKFIFRNSNPAIFGVKVLGGKAKVGMHLIDNNGEPVARIKSLQMDKASVNEAGEGSELALALPGTTFDRRMKDVKFLYSDMGSKQFKQFKVHRNLLSSSELKVLSDIFEIKKRKDDGWGV